MSGDASDDRLRVELQALEALRSTSTIFSFESEGDPPERYKLTFRGQGVSRSAGNVEIETLHQVELRLPYDYPLHPPDVRWRTPILHPNISYSGGVNLKEIGIEWTPDQTLPMVCERLWDVARLAFINPNDPSNFSAEKWLQEQTQFTLPVDQRPLRDKVESANPNVVRYTRRGDDGVILAETAPSGEVLFIDEHTPTPVLPRPAGDGDVLYIE